MSSTRKLSGFLSPGNRICTVSAAVKRNGRMACGAAPCGFGRLAAAFGFAVLAFVTFARLVTLLAFFAVARLALAFFVFAALMANPSNVDGPRQLSEPKPELNPSMRQSRSRSADS